jgi:hypothetical protein
MTKIVFQILTLIWHLNLGVSGVIDGFSVWDRRPSKCR